MNFMFQLINNFSTPTGFKTTIDVTKKNPFSLNNYKFLGDPRFSYDLKFYPKLTSKFRLNNEYPLTFGERKQWITQFKDNVLQGENFVMNNAKTLPQINKAGYFNNDLLIPNANGELEATSLTFSKPKSQFGTRSAINYKNGLGVLSDNTLEWAGYNIGHHIFDLNGKILYRKGTSFYPFRTDLKSLLPNANMRSIGDRILVGGHETTHLVLKKYDTPMADWIGDDSYKTMTPLFMHENHSAMEAIRPFEEKNGEAGKNWFNAISELDAEKGGWSAQYGWPKYSKMKPEQKALLLKLTKERFGDYPEIDYDKIFSTVEDAGYWKNGGKLQ